MNLIQFYDLLPKFTERWLHGEEIDARWQVFDMAYAGLDKDGQKKALAYYPIESDSSRKQVFRGPTTSEWKRHFEQRPVETTSGFKSYTWGSLAICGFFGSIVKWICWDADTQEELEILETKIIPWLTKNGIEYILEYSQAGRGHLWVFCNNIPYKVGEAFAKRVEEECGKVGECYPFGWRKKAVIRVIGGWHWWAKKASDCIYQGEVSSDGLRIMQFVCDIELLTTEKAKSLVPEPVREPEKRKGSKPYDTFIYLPRDLPLPFPDMSAKANTLNHNCQAFRNLILGIKEKDILEERGIDYHQAGLRISGILLAADIWDGTTRNIEWFNKAVENYRSRDDKSHMWNNQPSARAKYEANTHPLMPDCETMDKEFHLCKGCPFKGMANLKNLRRFWWNARPMSRKKVKDINLVSLDDVRIRTFSKVRERVLTGLREEHTADILIASGQGTGKSVMSDRLAVEIATTNLACRFANANKNILIAVPTGELAMQHKARCQERGVYAHVLRSHEGIFSDKNPMNLGFDCPSYDEIQYYIKLGASSQYFKKKYCKSCPHFADCPYPRQYVRAGEPDVRITIIQHAHLQCPEVIQQLRANKQYDIMIIDESIVDNFVNILKPSEAEFQLLLDYGFEWADKLGTWMRDGGYPKGKLYPNLTELEMVRLRFEDNKLEYDHLRNFISAYNQKSYMDPFVGCMVFHPLPNIPIRIFTDATPPLEMLQIFLDNQNIEVFGADEIIDIREYHPENEIITVLDSTNSKSRLGDGDKTGYKDEFYDRLNIIGEKCLGPYKADKVLVTVYIAHVEESVRYLKEKYPTLDVGTEQDSQIMISTMKVGTNEFADRTIQFLMAEANISGADYAMWIYKLKLVQNYFLERAGHDYINNIFPIDVEQTGKSGVQMDFPPVTVVEPDGIFAYKDFIYARPRFKIPRLIYRYMVGKSQQACRIRFNPTIINGRSVMITRKKIYKFTNQPHDGILSTKVVTMEQLYAEIQ